MCCRLIHSKGLPRSHVRLSRTCRVFPMRHSAVLVCIDIFDSNSRVASLVEIVHNFRFNPHGLRNPRQVQETSAIYLSHHIAHRRKLNMIIYVSIIQFLVHTLPKCYVCVSLRVISCTIRMASCPRV